MQKEKYGFVYIWRDRKHNRYYIGSHWGTVDDGYVCSSTWMRHAHRRRSKDFKRRILKKIYTNQQDLLIEEQKWIDLIPEDQFSIRYYNHNKKILQNAWWIDPERAKTSKERISIAVKVAWQEPQKRERLLTARKECGNKISLAKIGHSVSQEARKKIGDASKGRVAWNKGKTGIHYSPSTEIKLGQRISPKTEIQKGQHLSKRTQFPKGHVPWNKKLINTCT